MKYFSMFSGIGGFELGIEKAYDSIGKRKQQGIRQRSKRNNINKQSFLGTKQFTCIGFSEIDKYAIQIYKRHFPKHKNFGDATKIIPEELPDFDLLCGGFPCQSFSIAGKRKGFEDTRGTLFFEICRIARVKRPAYLFLENVRGLLSHDNGYTFLVILESLAELGYSLQWQVLNSKDFGVPQNRERVFIIGHLTEASTPKVFPVKRQNTENVEKSKTQKKNFACTLATQQPDQKSGADGTVIGINNKIRRLIPIECERLQGFPDGWTEGISDTQRYKCLGNAVTVNVIEAIMTRWLENETV